jgi:thioesterase domain-containing protein
MGWQRWTTGPVEAHPLPGAHLEVFEPQHIHRVAEAMSACIRAAVAEEAVAVGR